MPGGWLAHGVNAWSTCWRRLISQRTAVFDELLLRTVAVLGIDAVLNLGAGLDARVYRLPLPRSLRWLDVDLPEMVAERRVQLERTSARCHLETIALDLAHRSTRQALFERLNSEAGRVLVLTEGLLLYLAPTEVAALAADLYAQSSFAVWLTDLMSPIAARQMQHAVGLLSREPTPRSGSRPRTARRSSARMAGNRPRFGWHSLKPAASAVRSHCLGRCLSSFGWLSPGRDALAGLLTAPSCSHDIRKPDVDRLD